MSRPANFGVVPVSAAWLTLAALMAIMLVLRLELSFDLSAFLPKTTELESEVLLEQLSSGPASRMMVIGINGGTEPERLETGRRMRQALSRSDMFSTVFNGEVDIDAMSIPEPIFSHYPLMADIDYSAEALRNALRARLADLAFGGGRLLRELVTHDPYFVTLGLLRRLVPGISGGSAWLADDGSAVVTAQTRAPSTDLEAQAKALQVIHEAFEEAKTESAITLDVTGVGAFSLELQSTIRAEARFLGILAGSSVILVLLSVYRSIRMAFIATIPLGLGYMAGLTIVALAFDTVHGITLAFGFTLLGVAVDYPLHLFSHARAEGGQAANRSIWPTLRLGAASTATAYLAMAVSGSQGLSQLGLFTAVGVLVAMLATHTWLPLLLGNQQEKEQAETRGKRRVSMQWLPAAAVAIASGAAIAFLAHNGFWNDDMAKLSPVPEQRLQADQNLRAATGGSQFRHQLIVESSDLDALLEEGERVDGLLRSASERGQIDSWSSISTLLPSLEVQNRRLNAIPSPEAVSGTLRAALAPTAFLESAFSPFENLLKSIPVNFPLTPEKFNDTPLESWKDAHLIELQDQWAGVVTLSGPNVQSLGSSVSDWGPKVHWLDMQSATRELMRDFRRDAAGAVLIAILIIVVLLYFQGVRYKRLAWVALTVTAALLVSTCVVILAHGFLTLVHLISLLLVLGLGLDYSLFLSRDEGPEGRKATIESVLACAASTTLAFGILSTSSIPLLRFIGLTVAVGSIANVSLAWLGSRRLQSAWLRRRSQAPPRREFEADARSISTARESSGERGSRMRG